MPSTSSITLFTFSGIFLSISWGCFVFVCKHCHFLVLSAGFTKFDPTDQYNIVRLGQSQSRILAAACHWYNKTTRDFDYFLSWKPKNALREHKFKDSCVKYAEMIAHRDWDAVESALTNVLIMIATGELYRQCKGSTGESAHHDCQKCIDSVTQVLNNSSVNDKSVYSFSFVSRSK